MNPGPFESITWVAKDLTYQRAGADLFAPVSFSLSNGGIIWVQGENGVGKTTLMRVLAGLCAEYSGQLILNGKSWHRYLASARYMPHYLGHHLGLHPNLTALENLNALLGLAHPMGWQPKNGQLDALLARVGLADKADQATKYLSQGQCKRLALATLHWLPVSPIWILDEPFASLDVAASSWLFQVMQNHLRNHGLIFFSSHQSELNQQLASLKPIKVHLQPASFVDDSTKRLEGSDVFA